MCTPTERSGAPTAAPAEPANPPEPLALEFVAENAPDAPVRAVVDPHLAAQLKPHQVAGLQTLFRRLGGGRKGYGAVLGDGMGLGKTVQAIALVYTLLTSRLAASALVLVPSSLLGYWVSELSKWLDGVATPLRWDAVGDGAQDRGAAAALEQLRCARAESPYMVVMSYDRFWRAEGWVGQGGRVDLLVCDEAHTLKNPSTYATRAIASLPSCARLLLTATPVQNVLLEMHVLASLAVPGVWGSSADFYRAVQQPIEAASRPGASDEQRLEGAMARLLYQAGYDSLVLVRESKVVQKELGLPTPHVYMLLLPMSPLQREVHAVLTKGELSSSVAFARLALLEQVLIHPHLLEASRSGLARHVAAALPRAWPRDPRTLLLAAPATAAALHILERALKLRERVVITCSFKEPLKLFAAYLRAARVGYVSITGDHDQFAKAEAALNNRRTLIGANHLILLAPSWNYKKDEQVLGRLYRPGQERPTHHYRLVMLGSVSERIVIKQQAKQDLSALAKAAGFRKLPAAEQAGLLALDPPEAPSRLLGSLGLLGGGGAGAADAEDEDGDAAAPATPAVSMFGTLAFGGGASPGVGWLPLSDVNGEDVQVPETSSSVPPLAAAGLVRYMLHACELQWTN